MMYEVTKLGKTPIIRDTENYFFLNLDNACVELNKKEEQLIELKRINSICEEQIKELRRLIHIATHNDFIKDSKKEEWKKELMRE